jgi:periplasmic protein TonB
MSRLQKKCFIGATGFHLLLLALLIVGPVFLSPGESDPTPMLEFVPVDTTEAQVSGGGTPLPPTPTPAPPAAQSSPTQPEVQQPAPQPPPQRDPVPPKVERVTPTRPDLDSLEPKQGKKVHKVEISDKVINPRERKPPTKPLPDPAVTAAAAAAATARANAERNRKFTAALNNIRSGLTSSTQVEMPTGPNGPGGGGASYAGYKDEVRRIYFEAWRIPDDVTDDEATVKVSVTIARTGHVISSRIIQSSGSKLVDKSIQSTLDRVTFVRPFPEGSKDSQNTFNITFSLKAKKLG